MLDDSTCFKSSVLSPDRLRRTVFQSVRGRHCRWRNGEGTNRLVVASSSTRFLGVVVRIEIPTLLSRPMSDPVPVGDSLRLGLGLQRRANDKPCIGGSLLAVQSDGGVRDMFSRVRQKLEQPLETFDVVDVVKSKCEDLVIGVASSANGTLDADENLRLAVLVEDVVESR